MIEMGRTTADHQGPIVIFLIGTRINRVFALRKWLPVLRAMSAMLKELAADKESGFMGAETVWRGWRTPMLIQYWRSFDHLHAYANDPAREHQPAWRAFNRAVGGDGTVGIFHETYVVPAGGSETLYANMPAFGLGAAVGTRSATGSRNDARGRLAAAGQKAD